MCIRGVLAGLAVSLMVFGGTSYAHAARNIVTGLSDPAFTGDAGASAQAFGLAKDELAGVARVDIRWRSVAGESPPTTPADPADPSYDFASIDRAVENAHAAGLAVSFMIYSAPDWAEGPDRPPVSPDAPEGTWKPDPAALGQFAEAVGRRYDGTFVPPGATVALPEVDYFEVWNEENLWVYLSPQYTGKHQTSVDLYRRMLNSVDKHLKDVRPNAKVLIGGNAPYGDDPPGLRTRPLLFLKDLFCLDDKTLQPISGCKRARFDILGVHPINLSGGPNVSAINDDDVSSADVPNVVDVLRTAERANTVSGHDHKIWATEFWWESADHNGAKAVPGFTKHARWIEQALYLFWKAGVKVAINLQVCDAPASTQDELDATLQSGLFFADCTPKPAATSFRFPFVLDRSRSQLVAWGKAPLSGKLRIEKRVHGRWRAVETLNVRKARVFKARLRQQRSGTYRASIESESSVEWPLRR